MRFLLPALTLLVAAPTLAQGPQYRARTGTFALTDCRIETVTRGTVERGTVVIQDGQIAAVGAAAAVPSGAVTVPCDGGTVYPGFIDAGTRIGLQEVGSVDETQDYNELGDVTPQMEALTAVNPSTIHVPITRLSGVTTALSVPEGGLMPGTAALVNMHGYTPAQMSTGFEAVVLNFPTTGRRGPFDRREQEAIDKAAEQAIETLDETWEQAALYARIDSARTAGDGGEMPYQPEFAALLPVVRGERVLLVEANAAADIVKAIEWLDGRGVSAVLTGAAEGWRVADQIAASGLPVITGPVLGLPTRDSDRYSRVYENAALMAQAGVPVALQTQDRMQNYRNLPFHAGFAVAFGERFGFDRQAALEAITIAPARMFGVDDRMGSIEAGKQATLFIADGDPFEPATEVTAVFVGGYQVPLVSRQTELYEEFLNREPGLTTPPGGE